MVNRKRGTPQVQIEVAAPRSTPAEVRHCLSLVPRNPLRYIFIPEDCSEDHLTSLFMMPTIWLLVITSLHKAPIAPEKLRSLHKSSDHSTKAPITPQKLRSLHKSSDRSTKAPIALQKLRSLYKSSDRTRLGRTPIARASQLLRFSVVLQLLSNPTRTDTRRTC